MDQWDPADQWDLVDQWDLEVQWGQADLWEWDLEDTWVATMDQWVLAGLWALVDQWDPGVRWTWDQTVRWVVIWDIWDLRWEWDRCHPCQDQCQCLPCLICQCLQWEGRWDLDLVLWEVQGGLVGLEDLWEDLEDQCQCHRQEL